VDLVAAEEKREEREDEELEKLAEQAKEVARALSKKKDISKKMRELAAGIYRDVLAITNYRPPRFKLAPGASYKKIVRHYRAKETKTAQAKINAKAKKLATIAKKDPENYSL
jgi:hypothetical protein